MPDFFEHQITGIRRRWTIRIAIAQEGFAIILSQGTLSHANRTWESISVCTFDLTPRLSPVPEGDVIVALAPRYGRRPSSTESDPDIQTLSANLISHAIYWTRRWCRVIIYLACVYEFAPLPCATARKQTEHPVLDPPLIAYLHPSPTPISNRFRNGPRKEEKHRHSRYATSRHSPAPRLLTQSSRRRHHRLHDGLLPHAPQVLQP